VTFRFIFAAAALLVASSALATNTEEAREHYQKATSHFAVGEFADAAVEYQAAYKAKPDPALLYDAAQAYRLANNPERALILYRNYLQLYPNEPNIGEVRAQIEKLKDAIAAADKAKTAPPTGTNEPTRIAPEQPEPATARPASTPATSTNAPVTAATTSDRDQHATPIYKKWWLWTAIGVVVAGGVVLAVVLSTQTHGTWANAPDVGPGSANGLTIAAVRW
jgi:tetratricopeptide (TPR) repeat protein